MNRDNNLGMWSRGPDGEGDDVSGLVPEYTDDMSRSERVVLPPSPTFTLVSSFLLLFMLSYTIPLTVIL